MFRTNLNGMVTRFLALLKSKYCACTCNKKQQFKYNSHHTPNFSVLYGIILSIKEVAGQVACKFIIGELLYKINEKTGLTMFFRNC